MDFNRKTIGTTGNDNRFSVLSYNVWFDENFRIERISKLVSLINIYEPDIVCFQELTKSIYKLVEEAVTDNYYIFQIFTNEDNPYGTALAFKKETTSLVDKPYYFDYSGCTRMDRRIIGCEAHIAGTNIHFLTTHLESLSKNAPLRSKQFDVIEKAIGDLDNVIIAGDFNITGKNEEIEHKIAASRLEDCWIKIGCPSRIAWTYDGRTNSNIKGNTRSRLDRIYYGKGSRDFRIARMQLIGRSHVSSDIQIPASDHYGLLTDFIVKDNTD